MGPLNLNVSLISNKAVEEYGLKNEGIVFKIDFEKAYDYVDWVFWICCGKGRDLVKYRGC